MLVWLSGDDSCPVRGENERIMVWPHLGSHSVLEVSASCPPGSPVGDERTMQVTSWDKERKILTDRFLN